MGALRGSAGDDSWDVAGSDALGLLGGIGLPW